MSTSTRGPLPLTAWLVVMIYGLYTALEAVKAFNTGPGGLPAWSDFTDAIFALVILVGLLTRQGWAWWLALLGSLAAWVVPLVLLNNASFLQMDRPEGLDQRLVQVGIIGLVAFALLLSGSCRRAYRGA